MTAYHGDSLDCLASIVSLSSLLSVRVTALCFCEDDSGSPRPKHCRKRSSNSGSADPVSPSWDGRTEGGRGEGGREMGGGGEERVTTHEFLVHCYELGLLTL